MSKFTPAPWKVGFKTDGELVILAGNEVIARIEPNRDNEISDANARLIAAAPEMYEVLKVLYEGLPGVLGSVEKTYRTSGVD